MQMQELHLRHFFSIFATCGGGMEVKMKKTFMGIDLGGTKINIAWAFENGDIFYREKLYVKDLNVTVNEQIIILVENCIKHSINNSYSLKRFGLGIPGVYTKDGRIALNTNLKGLDIPYIKKSIYEKFSIEMKVMNDVRCAALGEKWKGVAKGCNDFIYINIGTGISAGIVSGGRIISGHDNAAGEIAYFITEEDIQTTSSGIWQFDPDKAPFERKVSGRGISELLKEKVEKDIYKIEGYKKEELSAKNIFKLAHDGEPACIEALNNFIKHLSVGIANLCIALNPEMVVFGGGLSNDYDIFAGKIDFFLKALTPYPPKIARAGLGYEAGLYGALYLAIKEID